MNPNDVVDDNYMKMSRLEDACYNSDLKNIKILLAHEGINPNWGIRDPPLRLACRKGFIDCVRLLLDHPKIDASVVLSSNDSRYAQYEDCTKLVMSHPSFCVSESALRSLLLNACRHSTPAFVRRVLRHPICKIDNALDVIEAALENPYDKHLVLCKLLDDSRIVSQMDQSDEVLILCHKKGNLACLEIILAYRNPRRWDYYSVPDWAKELMREYNADPHKTEAGLLAKLKILDLRPENLYVKISCIKEGYIANVDDPSVLVAAMEAYPREREVMETALRPLRVLNRIHRFVAIACLLPIDLQMLICNRVFGVAKDAMKEPGLEVFRTYLLEKEI